MTTEEWLEHVRRLKEALRDKSSERDRYRTGLCGTWAFIGVVISRPLCETQNGARWSENCSRKMASVCSLPLDFI
jgi:hypothetical protein